MSISVPQSGRRSWLARSATAVRDVLREMDHAQQLMQARRMSYNAYVPDPGQAPDTYPEFLLRTRALARHEPTARERSAGRQVR